MIHVCRLCLDSDIKLYDIFQSNIAGNIENILGFLMKPNDKLPHYLCAICVFQLYRCDSFMKRCQTSQQLLLKGLFGNDKITMTYIKSIDRTAQGLTLPYTICQTPTFDIKYEDVEEKPDITQIQLKSCIVPIESGNKPIEFSNKPIESGNKPMKSVNKPIKSGKVQLRSCKVLLKPCKVPLQSYDTPLESKDVSLELQDEIDNNYDEPVKDEFSDDDDTNLSNLKHPVTQKINKGENNYKCDVCGDEFRFKSQLKFHKYKHVTAKEYYCVECDIRFKSERNLNLHLLKSVKHQGKPLLKPKPLKSKESPKTKKAYQLQFTTVITRNIEEQKQDIEKRKLSDNYNNSPFKCHRCFKGFIAEHCFNNHMERHELKSGNKLCKICDIRCHNQTKLKQHMINVHEKKYQCNLCVHLANTSSQAKLHELWHKGHTYQCDQCGEKFKKSTSHLTHVRLHHPSNHVCHICGSSFLGAFGLSVHMMKTHKYNKINTPEETSCSACDMHFKSALLLKRHIMTSDKHTNDNIYIFRCKNCDEAFELESELTDHIKIHVASTVQCKECKKTFPNHRSCALHYRKIHIGVEYSKAVTPGIYQMIVCEICGLKCRSTAALIAHQRMHTGEKPFKCTFCTKCFAVKHRLVLHERVHSGERPYLCTLCPKAFASKAAINRHARVHTGEKPYSCMYCGKVFTQSNSMKLHIRTVHHKLPALYKSKRGKVTPQSNTSTT